MGVFKRIQRSRVNSRIYRGTRSVAITVSAPCQDILPVLVWRPLSMGGLLIRVLRKGTWIDRDGLEIVFGRFVIVLNGECVSLYAVFDMVLHVTRWDSTNLGVVLVQSFCFSSIQIETEERRRSGFLNNHKVNPKCSFLRVSRPMSGTSSAGITSFPGSRLEKCPTATRLPRCPIVK